MTPAQKQRYGGNTYTAPVCDHEQAARAARKAVGDYRKQHLGPDETRRVLDRHGSRRGPVQKRPEEPDRKRKKDQDQGNQLSLF